MVTTIKKTAEVPQIIKNKLPYNPGILLLIIYPRELKSRTPKDISTPMFIAAQFTRAKRGEATQISIDR